MASRDDFGEGSSKENGPHMETELIENHERWEEEKEDVDDVEKKDERVLKDKGREKKMKDEERWKRI